MEDIVMHCWLMYGDLCLNTSFFERGILIVTPKLEEKLISQNDESFIINDREFFFSPIEKIDPLRPTPDARALKKSQALLTTLVDFARSQNNLVRTAEKMTVLFNKRRRNEIFLPLLFQNQQESSGTYLYPWVTKSITSFQHFNGFSQFVTAGCMFGASLRAIPDQGEEVELVNHQLRLKLGAKIIAIRHDNENNNPFEQVLFHEFEKNCLLIKSLAKPNSPISLFYHLPVYDYILFGIKLSLAQQMTDEALNNFIKLVLERKIFYEQMLNAIAQPHGIAVIFESPFANLFDNINALNVTPVLFKQLNLMMFYMIEDLKDREKAFVNFCLHRLTSNDINPRQKTIWQDAIKIKENIPETLEDLFKLANAILIATAANNQSAYQTCSLLPLSEKQIQVHYEALHLQFTKHFPTDKNPYPATFNLTTMEPVITYSPTTNGLLFYFACYLQTLTSLLTDKKVTYHAARNLSLFAQSNLTQSSEKKTNELTAVVDLQSLLPEAKLVLKH